MAARIRRELGVDVETIHGRYGEFQVQLDGQTLVDGGPLGMMGILPSGRKIVETVRVHLQSEG